jgi:hypothetical protein
VEEVAEVAVGEVAEEEVVEEAVDLAAEEEDQEWTIEFS